jgi:hypothetical protein
MSTKPKTPQPMEARTTEQEQNAEMRLKRQLGEGEPRAWALAWCEAGLVRQTPGRGESEGPRLMAM